MIYNHFDIPFHVIYQTKKIQLKCRPELESTDRPKMDGPGRAVTKRSCLLGTKLYDMNIFDKVVVEYEMDRY